jgi:hypothetical protein
LPTNSTAWLFYDQLNSSDDIQSEGIIGTSMNNQNEITISMANNTYNWFGLRYVSVGVAGTSYSTGSKVNDVISAGHASTSWDFSNPYNVYVQAAQPQFKQKSMIFGRRRTSRLSFLLCRAIPVFRRRMRASFC